MNRRDFFTASVAPLAAGMLPAGVLPAGTAGLFESGIAAGTAAAGWTIRALFRLENGRWVRRRMRDLVVGDRFRMEDADDPTMNARIMQAAELPVRDEAYESQEQGWMINAMDLSSTRAEDI